MRDNTLTLLNAGSGKFLNIGGPRLRPLLVRSAPIYSYRADVISQYANSPVLLQLVENMARYFATDQNLDNFYRYIWNVDTATAYGLDVWGRIVDVSRQVSIPIDEPYFGFKDTGNTPFNDAPFYNGNQATTKYLIEDDNVFRRLIIFKAMLNISNLSVPSINRMLWYFFAGRGRCYVADTRHMTIEYVFHFPLQPFEVAILTNSECTPRPAGVLATVRQILDNNYIGFSEAESWQPFGSGALFS
jgi:hypothetical protein